MQTPRHTNLTQCVITQLSDVGKVRYATLAGDTLEDLKQHALTLLNPGERCMFVFESKVYSVVCS